MIYFIMTFQSLWIKKRILVNFLDAKFMVIVGGGIPRRKNFI